MLTADGAVVFKRHRISAPWPGELGLDVGDLRRDALLARPPMGVFACLHTLAPPILLIIIFDRFIFRIYFIRAAPRRTFDPAPHHSTPRGALAVLAGRGSLRISGTLQLSPLIAPLRPKVTSDYAWPIGLRLLSTSTAVLALDNNSGNNGSGSGGSGSGGSVAKAPTPMRTPAVPVKGVRLCFTPTYYSFEKFGVAPARYLGATRTGIFDILDTVSKMYDLRASSTMAVYVVKKAAGVSPTLRETEHVVELPEDRTLAELVAQGDVEPNKNGEVFLLVGRKDVYKRVCVFVVVCAFWHGRPVRCMLLARNCL